MAGGSASRGACTGRGPGCEGWACYRACTERTANMAYMVVTLDVSKLSGWLKADAFCRVERRANDVERGVDRGREGMGRRQHTSGMHGERARLWRLGARACAERTKSM